MSWFKSKKSEIYLGRAITFPFKKEVLTEAQLNHHVHVVGASGFGKTVLLSHIVKDRIRKGKGLTWIDLKGDIETIDLFKSYVRSSNRENDAKYFSLENDVESGSYNILGHGTPTQLRDRVMLSLNWSEEFYRNQSSSFLLKLFICLCHLRDLGKVKIDLSVLHNSLRSAEEIERLALADFEDKTFVRQTYEDLVHFCRNLENWRSLQGLRTQIESLVLSGFGSKLRESDNAIDLFQSANSSSLNFIFLDSRRYGESAKTIGRL